MRRAWALLAVLAAGATLGAGAGPVDESVETSGSGTGAGPVDEPPETSGSGTAAGPVDEPPETSGSGTAAGPVDEPPETSGSGTAAGPVDEPPETSGSGTGAGPVDEPPETSGSIAAPGPVDEPVETSGSVEWPGRPIDTTGGVDPRPTGQIGEDRPWDLVFNDGFDAAELDSSAWASCYWWADDVCTNAANRELQCYAPDGVDVRHGVLHLVAQERLTDCDGQSFGYGSGMVSGMARGGPRRVFQYGFFEMRALVPSGRGLWPAFWLLPASEESEPEIDVMEILGHTPRVVRMNYHWQEGDEERSAGAKWRGPDMSAGWHTFAVDWTPRRVRWFVDGVPRLTVTADQAVLPREPMYLLATLAVGGNYPGPPGDDTAFPATFEIDYIRVWRERPGR